MDNEPPTAHRITEFVNWQAEGRLDIAPPFQRKPVWNTSNKSYLIDTIINHFPIPEIYLQVKTDKDGHTKYIVVDGQQRIRAILGFVGKDFAILEEDNRDFGGKYFNELPDGVMKDFWDYKLVVRELKTSNDTDVKEVFRRLNKNVVPLNSQELRHATYSGLFAALVYQLADDEYWTDNKVMTPNDVRRMLDAEFISEILIAMIHAIDKKDQDSIDSYYRLHDDAFSDQDEIRKRFNHSRQLIEDVVGDLRPTRWHNKAEYYALFLAFADLTKDYTFPSERYPKIRDALMALSRRVDEATQVKKGETLGLDEHTRKFVESIQLHTTDKEARINRMNVVRRLTIPFLVARDPKRKFNDEEKRIIWDSSTTKACGFCGRKVENFEDYEPNHITRHTDGGKTEIANGEVTHRTCNRGDKPRSTPNGIQQKVQ